MDRRGSRGRGTGMGPGSGPGSGPGTRGGTNPWNRGNQHSQSGSRQNTRPPADNRFEKAQAQMQAAAQKHFNKEYESSSEEEELESESILGSVLKSYAQLSGSGIDLGRTQRFLEDAFQSGAATCLICIASVKRNDAIWSCTECYCFFHLPCIQRWSKDSIAHQKIALEEQPRPKSLVEFNWACPKCRTEYAQSATPQKYECFCGRVDNPPFHPWNVPHSCGETCGRALQPLCGHECLLLCHPGPCPPCPKTVNSLCFCGQKPARLQRCSNKTWSCGSACGRTHKCGRHKCTTICHQGECPPCPKTSVQQCQCGLQKRSQPCTNPEWQCETKCSKSLDCGNHCCEKICHSGPCGTCPLSLLRTCPCGKASYTLPCTKETPTCGDTCGNLLECGSHVCSRPCHRDRCGSCLEVVKKHCRCGLHEKELPCQNKYLCETKCKNSKDCRRHPCNRKCCDGNCPPCEKPCDRTLPCGRHKCASVCHRGPCYPCPLTADVSCRCRQTVLSVPCGRQKKTKPPRCSRLCALPPDCHHPRRQNHRCHFGDCPSCQLICDKSLHGCSHKCPAPCHSAVWVTIEGQKPAGPWEKVAPVVELRDLPCPVCMVPMPVTCLGGHETADWPCHIATPSSCQRQCGRRLACGNHQCSLPCHLVEGAASEERAGTNCQPCERGCSKERPAGCSHACKKPCHPGTCSPCGQMLRIRCHCTLNQLYVRCGEWTTAEDEAKEKMQSCTNQCPKTYECSHRCQTPCHVGDCPNPESCHKKVKVFCSCRRVRREFSCDLVRSGQATVPCDDICRQQQETDRKAKEIEAEQKRLEEEKRNKEELEKFEKKFQGRKKHRERRHADTEKEMSFFRKYWIYIAGSVGLLVAVFSMVYYY